MTTHHHYHSQHIMNNLKVSELTVSQLKQLIKDTVQEAMIEVLIEINTVAEADAEIAEEAEITEYLRSSLQGQPRPDYNVTPHLDD